MYLDPRDLLRMVRDPASKHTTKKPEPFWSAFAEVCGLVEDWAGKQTLDLAAGWMLGQYRRLRPHKWNRDSILPGHIVEVELDVAYLQEFALQHPCLVLRKKGPLLTVVPLTSQDAGKGIIVLDQPSFAPIVNQDRYWWRVEFRLPGTDKVSIALIEHIRTISIQRVQELWKDSQQVPLVVSDVVLKSVHERITALAAPSLHSAYNRARKDADRYRNRYKQAQERITQLEAELNDARNPAASGD